MGGQQPGWEAHRGDERLVERFSAHADNTLALAYANSYHIGMSSLGFQRTWELVHRRPGWSCERLFADGDGMPLSVETDTPLNAFGAIAFSVSFEEDYVHLIRMLDRAGIPARREDRGRDDPVVLMGGSCATINPLPMSSFVDVFPLGAAYHRPEADPAFDRLLKLDLREDQMRSPGHLPTTAIVTPNTEFANKFLIEMSRGCPEKCRYCWATFGMGRFRWHPTEFILEAFERARPVTDQLGFVATAVGDHPEIERLLLEANRMGFRSSVSSIRIPAVTEGVLGALHASGDRSITLAPETGSDELRVKLNKPLSNALLLDKVRLIFRQGFSQLKLYFIVGLPDETTEDVEAILDLVRECRAIMLEELAPTGVIGQIHVGANVLVPKPFTGWQREPMTAVPVLKERIAMLKRGVAALPNVSIGSMSVREAIWQTYLSKGGSEIGAALERRARGEGLSSLLRSLAPSIESEVFGYFGDDLRWQFMRSA
jgi:radical SAM superfamily enzyme YgiQ (UPF0313 family)